MAGESEEAIRRRRFWLEMRSLRVSFDDAMHSAVHVAPEPRLRAVEDVTRRTEVLFQSVVELAESLGGTEAHEAVVLLGRHIADRIWHARHTVSGGAGTRRDAHADR